VNDISQKVKKSKVDSLTISQCYCLSANQWDSNPRSLPRHSVEGQVGLIMLRYGSLT